MISTFANIQEISRRLKRNYAMPKKFRPEWMKEEHLKDWLQPHPEDDSVCVCTACNIVLRCGKSELEKHATGIKHTKKVEALKVYSHDTEVSHSQAQNTTQTLRLDHYLSKNDDQMWIPITSQEQLSMEDDVEEIVGDDEANEFIRSQTKEKTSGDTKLTEALVKLFEFADGKVDLSRKRLEMLQEEHALKLQILEKELQLKTLEVEIKETELRKLRLDALHSGVKDNQAQQNNQLTINDHQLHVITDQNFQEALQAHLQQFQSQFEQQHSQEPKQISDTLTS